MNPNLDELGRLLDAVERRPLAFTPTPLLEAPALAAHLGVPSERLLIKMDAWTGFGLGGNKVRKLEYELAPSRLEGVTCLITAGGPQSNHCRVTAAAAAWLGLRCILVVNDPDPDTAPPRGNALLHRAFGAEIVQVGTREERAPAMEEAAHRVAREGGRARVIPLGASTPLGALGYARAAVELLGQLQERDGGRPEDGPEPATRIVVSTSSGGTLAGLLLGLSAAGGEAIRVLGVSADDPPAESVPRVGTLVREAAALLGAGAGAALPEPTVEITDAFVGPGYGIPTPASDAAHTLFARRAGVLLDPTYTAKAAAGFLEAVTEAPGTRWIFWHTGGHPAVFR